VGSLFADAHNAKERGLRVRPDNPAAGLRGPERGRRKLKQFLYPSEFLQLAACVEVHRPRRRLYATAVYSYLRAGELDALEHRVDVDLAH
jgi:hypothetical protein